MTPESKQRLAEHVAARRKQLRLDQVDLKDRGGPSHAIVGQIERGQASDDMQRGTKAGLEVALEWVAGSVDSIIAGGTPVPLPPDPGTVRADSDSGGVLLSLSPESLADFDRLPAPDRDEALAAATAELLARMREVRRRVNE